MRLQSAMSTTFGRTIPLVDLFQRTTVESQAEQFAQARQADPVLARARARAMRQLKR